MRSCSLQEGLRKPAGGLTVSHERRWRSKVARRKQADGSLPVAARQNRMALCLSAADSGARRPRPEPTGP
jgi:hypothetical protein